VDWCRPLNSIPICATSPPYPQADHHTGVTVPFIRAPSACCGGTRPPTSVLTCHRGPGCGCSARRWTGRAPALLWITVAGTSSVRPPRTTRCAAASPVNSARRLRRSNTAWLRTRPRRVEDCYSAHVAGRRPSISAGGDRLQREGTAATHSPYTPGPRRVACGTAIGEPSDDDRGPKVWTIRAAAVEPV
jgi:hypothetical protein